MKKRVADANTASAPTTFIELAPGPLAALNECLIEWEDVAGARMRVQLKGHSTQILALSRGFGMPSDAADHASDEGPGGCRCN